MVGCELPQAGFCRPVTRSERGGFLFSAVFSRSGEERVGIGAWVHGHTCTSQFNGLCYPTQPEIHGSATDILEELGFSWLQAAPCAGRLVPAPLQGQRTRCSLVLPLLDDDPAYRRAPPSPPENVAWPAASVCARLLRAWLYRCRGHSAAGESSFPQSPAQCLSSQWMSLSCKCVQTADTSHACSAPHRGTVKLSSRA